MAAGNAKKIMKLALFDFDGTITTHDSFREFLLFIFGTKRFLLGLIALSPWLLGYVLKIIANDKAKKRVVDWFLRDMGRDEFDKLVKDFVQKKLNRMVRQSAMKKILWHLQQDHKIIVVSASFEDYLKVWCDQHQLEIIGTKLEWEDGKLTGKFATNNCYGPEKVKRIKTYLNLEEFEEIYAYGDSRGDREMLEIAQHKGYRVF